MLNHFTTIKLIISFVFLSLVGCFEQKPVEVKPNIIYIYTDQQSENMMSSAGNKYLKTPAMDYIANNGIRFTRAYTTNPVCSPARVSMLTGRFTGAFNDKNGERARENRGAMTITEFPQEVMNTTLPAYLNNAGYDLYFGGKRHLPKPLDPTSLGFQYFSNNERDILAEEAAKLIKKVHEKPYFMVISLINPHDICYMAIRDFASSESEQRIIKNGVKEIETLDKALKLPEGISEEEFYQDWCPPLPVNYEPQEDEPQAIKSLINRRNFKKLARANYSDKNWQMHKWAYCRLTETVDSQIQTILDALKESGQEENTLILYSSDHGDMDGAHRMEHKSTLYEEATNIPFMAMWKGKIPPGQVDSISLVSNGLDLLPTIADYIGVNSASDPRGMSLRPLFEGDKPKWRKTLGVESEIGRMVVSHDGFKYIKYDAEGIEEQLLNLNIDPFETTHFTNDPIYQNKLRELKDSYNETWFPGF